MFRNPRQHHPLVSLSSRKLPEVTGARLPIDSLSKELLNIRIDEARTYEVPVYPATKAEIIAAYQERYGAESKGRNGWKANLVRAQIAAGVSEAAARKALQPKRINQPGTRSEHWARLGQQLPPRMEERQHDLKGKRATVTASIHFKISERWKNAQFTRLLTQQRTQQLMKGDFTAALRQYGLPTGNIEHFEIADLTISL